MANTWLCGVGCMVEDRLLGAGRGIDGKWFYIGLSIIPKLMGGDLVKCQF